MKRALIVISTALAAISAAAAEEAVPVTPQNFVRAETDMYMGNLAKDGGFGKFHNVREPVSIDQQSVIRMNRDTIYSEGVFDLDAGPLTVVMPDAGKRYMALQVIDEDHYTHDVFYKPGSHTFTKKGNRHALCGSPGPHVGRSE